MRERLCDGCQKVTSAQRHDLNLHVEKTITLYDAFPVEHRVNTFVQHARQSRTKFVLNLELPRFEVDAALRSATHRPTCANATCRLEPSYVPFH